MKGEGEATTSPCQKVPSFSPPTGSALAHLLELKFGEISQKTTL